MEINTKYCAKCKNNVDIINYNKNKARKDGLNVYCKKCMLLMTKIKQENKIKKRVDEQYIEGEIWKIIPHFNKYEASTYGRIRNIKLKTLMTPTINAVGYCVSSLSNDKNKSVNIKFHRIIAETFIDNPQKKITINHIDKNRSNNKVNNLEWATPKEQIKHQLSYNPPNKKNIIIKTIDDLSNIDNNEKWKDINDYPYYQISNYGRINGMSNLQMY